MTADWKALVIRLVGDDPLTWSTEGLDDGCFFCGAMVQSIFQPTFRTFATHASDCPWVEAMRSLGRDLGLHQVGPDTGWIG